MINIWDRQHFCINFSIMFKLCKQHYKHVYFVCIDEWALSIFLTIYKHQIYRSIICIWLQKYFVHTSIMLLYTFYKYYIYIYIYVVRYNIHMYKIYLCLWYKYDFSYSTYTKEIRKIHHLHSALTIYF